MDGILKTLEAQGSRLLGGLMVLMIGFFLKRWIMRALVKSEGFSKIEPTLRGFLEDLANFALVIIVLLASVNVLGIHLSSILTVLASAGVAVSLAVQGTLSNFVGGIIILIVKPFVAEDYVSIADTEGTVKNINLFYTELTTSDNTLIFLPNNQLTNMAIVNHTREGKRRLDIPFTVSYDADIDHVRQALLSAVRQTPDIMDDPAPAIKVTACGENGMTFSIRAWCASDIFWDLEGILMENGKRALDEAGIRIPYRQMDVYMK